MKVSKIKAVWSLLTGGMAGIIKCVLNGFNEQILGRIQNKETALKYLRDIQAVCSLLRAIMENHSADMSAEQKVCMESILAALEELIKALEDFEVNETELDEFIKKVTDAIDAWKKAKK